MPRWLDRWGDGSDWRTVETWCPHCLHRLNGAGSPIHNTPPKPGDWSVCINCAAPLMLGPTLEALPVDPVALAAEPADVRAELAQAVAAIKAMHEAVGRPDEAGRAGRLRGYPWHQLVPRHVATQQVAYEGRLRVLRARAAGATYAQIAKGLGISISARGIWPNGNCAGPRGHRQS